MFPLGMVLLPGSVLPLHVFEERYRRLVQDLLADDDHPPELGVVLIERGREVGGGDERAGVGTVARVVDVRALPGGRYALATVGTERLHVRAWLPDDPYPRAEVERWPDEPDEPGAPAAGAVAELGARVEALNAELRELGRPAPPPGTRIDDDPRLALYHLGALAPLGPVDRYRLLAAPTLAARAGVLAAALDDVEAMLRFGRS